MEAKNLKEHLEDLDMIEEMSVFGSEERQKEEKAYIAEERRKTAHPAYKTWYRFKYQCRFIGEWEDFWKFAEWWDENYFDGAGKVIATGKSRITPNTLKFSKEDKHRRTGLAYKEWEKMRDSEDGLSEEWAEWDDFKDWWNQAKEKGAKFTKLYHGPADVWTHLFIKKHDPKVYSLWERLMKDPREKCRFQGWDTRLGYYFFQRWHDRYCPNDFDPKFHSGIISEETYMTAELDYNKQPSFLTRERYEFLFKKYRELAEYLDKKRKGDPHPSTYGCSFYNFNSNNSERQDWSDFLKYPTIY